MLYFVFWREAELHKRFSAPVESMLGTFHFMNKTTAPDPLQNGEMVPAIEEWEGKLTPQMLRKLKALMLQSEKYVPQPLPPPFNRGTVSFAPVRSRASFDVFIGQERMIVLSFEGMGVLCTIQQADAMDRRVVDLKRLELLLDECMSKTRKQTYVYRLGEWEPL